MTGDREYLRAADISRLTGISLRTIRRWIKDKILPSTKVGGARLVAMEDLKAALSASHDETQEVANDREESVDESEM